MKYNILIFLILFVLNIKTSVADTCFVDTTTLNYFVCFGDSIEIDSIFYKQGSYHDTLQNVHGCDSIIVTHVTSYDVTFDTLYQTQTMCGNSYIINDTTFDTTGVYTLLFTNIQGCDSVVVYDLTFLQKYDTTYYKTICIGDSAEFKGLYHTTSGIYIDSLLKSNGCDSIIIMYLRVYQDSLIHNPQTICQGGEYIFEGNSYSMSGNYYYIYTTDAGCDSTVVTDLTVIPTQYINNPQRACSSFGYTINNHTYYSSGVYIDTVKDYMGCDIIITTTLVILNTFTAITNGNWSNNSTWGGTVPPLSSCVIIPTIYTVTSNLNNQGCWTLINYGVFTAIKNNFQAINVYNYGTLISTGNNFTSAGVIINTGDMEVDGNNFSAMDIYNTGTLAFVGGAPNIGGVVVNTGTIEGYSGLPIELLNIHGVCDDGKIAINWCTASELNNIYFDIESSDNLHDWVTLERICGSGNSTSVICYTYNGLSDKMHYFRLKQVDFDGKTTVYQPLYISCDNITDDNNQYHVFDLLGVYYGVIYYKDAVNLKNDMFFILINIKNKNKILYRNQN